LWKLRNEEERDRSRLDLGSVDDPICQEFLRKLERAGLSVAVWDITSNIEIAAFACFIVPRDGSAMWHCSVAMGYGCHPVRQVALVRAVAEAAQARLTVISGLRDDLGRDFYEQWLDPDVIRAIRHRMSASPERRFRDIPSWDGETFEDDVEWELKWIRKAGVQRVVVVDLTRPEFGLPVVRVIVPGLEPILGPGYLPGPRGRAVFAGAP
jgi:ribosomal protein S12 methylthiotransferase accessory factor